jgi:hypothetical protein
MKQTAIIVAIGNSDNRLTQAEWSAFWHECNALVHGATTYAGTRLYGTWLSPANAPFQNAGWSLAFEIDMLPLSRELQRSLRDVLRTYRQDSMAWTVGETQLIPAAPDFLPVYPWTPKEE